MTPTRRACSSRSAAPGPIVAGLVVPSCFVLRLSWPVLAAAAVGLLISCPMLARPAAAQPAGTDVERALAAAERAYDNEDAAAAERAYAVVLAADPDHSRALFRLAQLRRDRPAESAALLERYVALVPLDPWGHLALASAHADAGRRAEALRVYDEALALEPEDRDIALGGPRLFARLGLTDRSISAYRAWLVHHVEDGEAWRELAEQLQRARRFGGAARAAERALQSTPGDGRLAARVDALRLRAAPAVEVGLLGIGETDVATIGGAVTADAARGESARLGVTVAQRRLSSLGEVAAVRRVLVRGSLAPRAELQLQVAGGVVWTGLEGVSALDRTRPEVSVRLRRRPAAPGLTLDLRGQHGPVDATPRLAVDDLARTQVTGTIEAPVASRLLLRGAGRLAAMSRPDERNVGTRVGSGLAFVAAAAVHVSGGWSQSRYRQPAVGYFAPRLTETIEAGVDLDREHGVVTVALDAGAGVQRVQRHGREMGSWGPAFRGWGLVAWTLRPGRQLLIECETYDSQVADAVIAAEQWRYASVTASFRLALR